MLNDTMINNPSKPENSHIVKYESIIIDAIHSQAFCFEDFDMSKFKRKSRLCKCGCEERVKWNPNIKQYNKYLHGHNNKGRNHPMKKPKAQKAASERQLALGNDHIFKNPEFRKMMSEKMTGENSPAKRPEVRKKQSIRMLALGDDHWMKKVEYRKLASINIFKKPPMKNLKSRKKVSEKLMGRKCPEHSKWMKENSPMIGKKRPNQSKRMKNGQAAFMFLCSQNSSKPQIKLFKLTKLLYPNAILEYPSLGRIIDIAVPDKMIAIEYDGSYWHQDKNADDKRQKELENIGWKFLRYKDYVPNIDELRRDLNIFN